MPLKIFHIHVCFAGVIYRQGRGTKSRTITISLSSHCGSYNRALRNEKLLFPIFSVGVGGGTVVTKVPGRFGPESFRSGVVSARVVSAWVVSALGRFGQIWWVVLA